MNTLKNTVQKKFKLPNNESQMTFQIPHGPKIAVKTEEDLKRAIAESVKTRAKFVDIEIGGKAPVSSAPPPSSVPASAKPSSPTSAPQPPGKGGHSGGPQVSTSDKTISFNLPGNGPEDKVKINVQPEATCYIFTPTPAKQPTLIEIDLPTSKSLTFKMTSNVNKLTQTFNLPFDVSLKDLTIQGTTVILNFPF